MSRVVSAESLRERLDIVREEIDAALERSGRVGDEVRLLVASKYYSPEQVTALSEAGATLLGENRAEDLVEKQEEVGEDFEWHFIGHLQRRKAKIVVPRVKMIHSLDSEKLVGELARRADEAGVGAVEALVQVNVSGEESKYGVREADIEKILEAAASTGGVVRIKGLMTIAPLVEEQENVRYVFAKLRDIRDGLKKSWRTEFDLSELSMGMSSDYAVAVEEGATIVRIGRTLIEEDGPVRRKD